MSCWGSVNKAGSGCSTSDAAAAWPQLTAGWLASIIWCKLLQVNP